MMRATAIPVALALILLSPALRPMQASGPAPVPDLKNLVAFSNRAEGAMFASLETTSPLIEAIFQDHVPAERVGSVIEGDRYDLARFGWSNGPVAASLVSRGGNRTDRTEAETLARSLAEIMAPDWRTLTPDRYRYTFVRKSFLGSVPVYVLDVAPLGDEGRFSGRIYIEQRTFSIVRFTGLVRDVDVELARHFKRNGSFRIDAWRMPAKENRFLPAYTYVEEVSPIGAPEGPLLKGQVRYWGYDAPQTPLPARFTDIELSPSEDNAKEAGVRWPSPQQSRRLFDAEAEDNLLARLERANFLGPKGSVEAMLEQVIANVIVSNQLILAAPVQARVLLTTPFELFTIGDTICVSRGLLDVIPSEPVLAFLLAHQISHNALGHRKVDSRFSFREVLDVDDRGLLERLRFGYSSTEEGAANARALQLLAQSPYKDMSEAGLFLQALTAQSARMPSLIQPHFGEHVVDSDLAVRNDDKFRLAPVLDHELPDQFAALPLGARLIMRPSDGQLELLRPQGLSAPTAAERAEFRVTPFRPFLKSAGGLPGVAETAGQRSEAPKNADGSADGGATPLPLPGSTSVPRSRPSPATTTR